MVYFKMAKKETKTEVKNELNLKGNSEFIAKCHLNLHSKDNKPSPDGEEIKVKKGEAIPEIFIPNFIRNNRDLIANLLMNDGIPNLTEEQQKKYGLSFKKVIPKTFSEEVKKYYPKWNLELLKQKLAKYIQKNGPKLGIDKFKNWTEKEFGEDLIDRRKSSDGIITQILKSQEIK